MQSMRSFRTSRVLARGSALMLATLVLGSARLSAQALPSPADVISKHLAAIGGKAALEKITSVRQIAQMDMPAMGISASADIAMGAPNRMATRINIPQMGEMITGTDGTVAWSSNPMQGSRLMEGKELEQIREQADLVGSLTFAADRFSSMTNEGVVDFAGEKAYKIKMVRKGSGNESWQYFSVATGLNIGSESTTTSEMGTLQTTTIAKDYKDFGGVKFPTRTEANMGPQAMIITIKDIQINNVPADAFAVPAAVQPLIKK